MAIGQNLLQFEQFESYQQQQISLQELFASSHILFTFYYILQTFKRKKSS